MGLWEGLSEDLVTSCSLEVIAIMAVHDGEYCFSYFARFIDNFSDFKWMSLGCCMIILYTTCVRNVLT